MDGMISPASNSRKRVCQVRETVRGTTPTNPAWKTLPVLDATELEATKSYERSAQMKSNRMGGQQVGGTNAVGGTLNLALKNDSSIRDVLESAFSGLFSNPTISGTGLAFTTTGGNKITDTAAKRFLKLGFRKGHTITVTGATTAGNNKTYKILSVEADGSAITVNGTVTAEAGVSGTTILSNAFFLKAGTARPTFSHEVSYLDLSPVVYEYFKGNEVNDGTIEIPTSGEATLELNMVGLSSTEDNTPMALGTGSRAAVEDVISFAGSVSGSGMIRDGQDTFDPESITVTFNNGREAKYGTGSENARFVEEGDFDSEIQASIYFTSLALRQKFRTGVRQNITIWAEDQRDKHRLVIEYPNAVITAAPKGRSGNTVTEQVTWFAEEDVAQETKALVWFVPNAGA